MSELKAPWPESNGISATYDLHCHCGKVKYKATFSPPLYEEHTQGKEQWTAVDCNCSHCERVGAINAHPLIKDVEFVQGEDNLVKYYSGSKKNPHMHCKDCGCFLVTDLTALLQDMGMEERMAMNLRMLKDFDRQKLSVNPVTFMKDMPPKYEV